MPPLLADSLPAQAYGDTDAHSPNLDALAARSLRFNHSYVQQAVCGPSRISFLTSRRPDTTRLCAPRPPDPPCPCSIGAALMGPPLLPDDFQSYWRIHAGNFTTLPQAFRTHGYDCHSFGKVFHPSKPSGKGAPKNYSWVYGEPATNADDYPFSWSSPPFHPPTQKDKNAPTCAASVPQQANTSALYSNMYCPVDPSAEPGGNLPDIQTADAALALLEGYSKAPQPRNPLFLAVGFHKVRRNAACPQSC